MILLDDELSYTWAGRGHRAGSVKCTAAKGASLMYGMGVEQDKTMGAIYLAMAAIQGSDFAANGLGEALLDGTLAKNKAEARHFLEMSLRSDCKYDHLTDESKDEAKTLLVGLDLQG